MPIGPPGGVIKPDPFDYEFVQFGDPDLEDTHIAAQEDAPPEDQQVQQPLEAQQEQQPGDAQQSQQQLTDEPDQMFNWVNRNFNGGAT